MKKLFFIFLFFISIVIQAQITFQKIYGGTGGDDASSVQLTSDGGFIIAGSTGSFGAGGADIYLIKTDSSGNNLWTKTFGGTGDDEGYSVQQTKDGGYIIVGSTTSFGSGSENVYLIKTDSNGNLLWSKNFGETNIADGNDVHQTSDGGFIVVGTITNNNDDVYLIKTDANGDTLWTKTFGGTNGGNNESEGYSVQQTTDGGYILTGTTNCFNIMNSHQVYLIKTDVNGDTLWTKTFGGGSENEGYYVQQTTDGGYIIVGENEIDYVYPNYSENVYIIKTNASGNELWSKTFASTNDREWGNFIKQTSDGGYIIAGTSGKSGAFLIGYAEVFLIKTDSIGNLLWGKYFGDTLNNFGSSVQQTKEGGYIIAGSCNSAFLEPIIPNFYLIKTDSLGNSGCNESNPTISVTNLTTTATNTSTQVSAGAIVGNPATQTGSGGTVNTLCLTGINNLQNEKPEIKISPNPFSISTTFSIQNSKFKLQSFVLYDVYGRAVKILNFEQGTKNFKLERGNLPSGIYFYKLSDSTKVLGTGKVIVE